MADPPKAVENFYKCYGDMQEAMAQFQAASRTPTIEQRLASLKLAEERLASLHELAKTVNANDLDAIYPQWGNRFTSDFLPAIDLLLRCTRTMDSGYANQASVHLAAWDQWLGAHFSKIGSRLNEKYGIETR